MLEKDYISCQLIGRLGNNMFQIAHAYSKALQYNRQLVIPRREGVVGDYLTNIFRKLDFFIDTTPKEYSLEGTFYFSPLAPYYEKPTIFHGYYQSEKYFGSYKSAIRSLFAPTSEFIEKALREYPQLGSGNVTAINVRRGDYLLQSDRHPVVTLDYIIEAIKRIPNTNHFLILSDDLEWCKQQLGYLPNATFSDYTTWEALWLLSLCDNFIISNSTFSWWGAWLANNPLKIVVAPETWFGPPVLEQGHLPTDIFCDSWVKIPTYYENGTIIPSCTII